jgi:hypothetical protein
MKIPRLDEAVGFLDEAETLNPGPWVQHSKYVAQAAKLIATHHPRLDPNTAYIMGYLHDIGRREGVTDIRHIIDGYHFLNDKGFDDAARICLTHSFPIKKVQAASGTWDCTAEELRFVEDFLDQIEFDEYDRLLALCDALCLSTGFCLIEKRLFDVALRKGFNDHTLEKWQGFLTLQKEMEVAIGQSIYGVLHGVVENTFGFDPANSAEK